MTRKLNRNYSLSVVVPFIATLTLLIAAVVLAQTSGAGQTTGNANAVLTPAGTSALAQAERPLTPWAGTGSSPVSYSQAKRHGARPMDENPLLFGPVMDYDSGGISGVDAAVADVNGDGKPDIVVTNESSNTVGVLLGNGDGTFRPAVTYYTGGSDPIGVAVADLNGKGKPDLVVANYESGTVGVLLGNGDGTFQPAVTYAAGRYPMAVAIADLKGDGRLDVVVGSDSSAGAGAVCVLLGNGDGTFQPAVTYQSGGGSTSIAVADVNGDDIPDLIVATGTGENGDGTVGVLLGNGDGTFRPVVAYDSGQAGTHGVAVADVNGDGKLDILTANGEIYTGYGAVGVLLGNGDGTFQPAVNYYSGGGDPWSVAVADLNGDGKPDLAVSNVSSNSVAVLLGNGDGTFQAAVSYGSGGLNPYSLALADVNGDSKPDLVLANVSQGGGGDGCVAVLLNGDATTTTLVSSPNPSVYGQAVILTAAANSASGTPPGTVIFYDGSTQIGSATLVDGRASISTSSLVAGSHSITAAYQGSGVFVASTSAPLDQVVDPSTTTTSLASSANPARVKQRVTYTAIVTGQYSAALTGTVIFQDDGATIGTVAISGNKATYGISYPIAGAHFIMATYSGDVNDAGSTSSVLTEVIGKEPFPSETTLATSGSPSLLGQPVTFTATVTSKNGTIPNGELVAFYDGTVAIGTGGTASGVATFLTSSLTAKTHTIKATYNGDAIFKPSSGTVTQVVDKYSTTTALSSNLNPSSYGQSVTFTATVTSAGPTPTGKVSFKDGTKLIKLVTMSGGVATLTTSKLAVATHAITAEYLGDADSAESTSPVLDQVVQ